LLPDPKRSGKFFSVLLENVIFDKAKVLEPSGNSEYANTGIARMNIAMSERTRKQQWK
jgi:hypothetical protein